MDVRVGLWRRLSTEELMLLNCGVGEDSWESLRLQGDPTSPFWRRSALGFLWREWCWSWNSSTLATSCGVLTHWKRLWCWEGLGSRGEGDDREWDAGWHRWLDGCESQWTPGVGDGQGGLASCDSWGRKESDMTERLIWSDLNLSRIYLENRHHNCTLDNNELLWFLFIFFFEIYKFLNDVRIVNNRI